MRWRASKTVSTFHNSRYDAGALAGWPGQVLLLESENDQALKLQEREALRAQYPQAEVYVFMNAPHEPWRTQREQYLRVLTGFLDGQ